jgi:hypothetical protein
MPRKKLLLIWTVVLLPVVFAISLQLLTMITVYSHGRPTPLGILSRILTQSIKGDEELFELIGLVLWTLSWSYFFAGLLTFRKLTWSTLFPVLFVVMSFLTLFIGALFDSNNALGFIIAATIWIVVLVTALSCYFMKLFPWSGSVSNRNDKV